MARHLVQAQPGRATLAQQSRFDRQRRIAVRWFRHRAYTLMPLDQRIREAGKRATPPTTPFVAKPNRLTLAALEDVLAGRVARPRGPLVFEW